MKRNKKNEWKTNKRRKMGKKSGERAQFFSNYLFMKQFCDQNWNKSLKQKLDAV